MQKPARSDKRNEFLQAHQEKGYPAFFRNSSSVLSRIEGLSLKTSMLDKDQSHATRNWGFCQGLIYTATSQGTKKALFDSKNRFC